MKSRLKLSVGDSTDVQQSFELTNAGTLRYGGFSIKPNGVANVGKKSGVAASTAGLEDIKEESLASPSFVGKTISRKDTFRLSELGQGQNGIVYKALYLPELDVVALKAVNIYDRAKRHQMLKELKAYSQVSSRYVVRLVGAYTDQEKGQLVMALEYMNRGSLKHIVNHHGAMSEEVLKVVAQGMAGGLRTLHRKKQLHRDIKPDNILLNHEGKVKISDFGLMKQLNSSDDASQTFVGTTVYLSPERLKGTEYSYPADIWAVGITLMFCATGDLPKSFTQDYWRMVTAVADKPPPSLDSTKFSPELVDFVDRCLCKDPDKRATAAELYEHPFVKGVDHTKVAWPYAAPLQQDTQDMVAINSVLLENQPDYRVGKFKNSLYDMAKFQRIAEQLGLSVQDVSRDFRRQFQVKFPDVVLKRSPQ